VFLLGSGVAIAGGKQMLAYKATATQREREQERQETEVTYIARPVEGQVDYEALRRDIMSRFGRALAYLGR